MSINKFMLPRWGWLVLMIGIITFGISPFKIALEQVNAQYATVEQTEWVATNVWLLAADCMRKTGVWLAICEENKLYPIANYTLADDPGHALLLGIKARIQNRAMELTDVLQLNLALNLAGLLLIALLIFATGSYVSSLFMLMLGSSVFSSWIFPSPHPSFIGAACFAFVFPAALLLMNRRKLSPKTGITFMLLGIFLLGLAALLREPIGIMGMLISIGAVIFDWLFLHNKTHAKQTVLLIFAVILVWQTPAILVTLRDAIFKVPPTPLIQSHGISHSIYLGLGAVDNKFGIRWDDSYAKQIVTEIDPNIHYLSEEYYSMMWKLYWQRVKEDPLEVARIYVYKFIKMLDDRRPRWSLPLCIILIGWIVILKTMSKYIAAATAPRLLNAYYEIFKILTTLSIIFILFFLLQGTLAHTHKQYAYPTAAFVLILISMAIELFCISRWESISSSLCCGNKI